MLGAFDSNDNVECFRRQAVLQRVAQQEIDIGLLRRGQFRMLILFLRNRNAGYGSAIFAAQCQRGGAIAAADIANAITAHSATRRVKFKTACSTDSFLETQ